MDPITYDILKTAAATGDVLKLLEHCEDPSHQQLNKQESQDLLTAAIEGSQISVVDYLYIKFPQLELDEATVRTAVRAGSIPIFSFLLHKDPSIINMQFDRVGTPLITACMSRQPLPFIEYLLQAGADPNQDPDVTGYPIALVSAFYNETAAIDLLLQHGARLERSGALGAAAGRGNEVMFRYLLAKGARPDTDPTGLGTLMDTPLHRAIWAGHAGIVRILLERDGGAGASAHGDNNDTMAGVGDHNIRSPLKFARNLHDRGRDRLEIIGLLTSLPDRCSSA